ncbi:TetR/AcrR family transcriptional regulator [Nocardia carnea]|uniref:TetR/AcrR family transcriptional regulator n=1 Tax=Nocardia carnea TaxID=37328 RepID=UPI0024549A7B|nr:helix-turn-helix domain-containing protein [Nocardia carnea]
MSMAERRTSAVRRRGEILDAALTELAAHGYQGMTIGAVAKRAGLTQQGLLHHFPTKETLLLAALEFLAERDSAQMPTAPDRPALPLSYLPGLVELNQSRPEAVRARTVLSAECLTDDHPARDYFAERFRMARVSMAHSIRREFGSGLAPGITPEDAATLLSATMNGLLQLWLLDPSIGEPAELVRKMLHLVAPSAGWNTASAVEEIADADPGGEGGRPGGMHT